MIQFKLNGQPIQMASSWEDLTMGQYLRLLNAGDDFLQLVSILSGIDYEILKKAEIIGLESVIQCTKFIGTKPDFGGTCDKVGSYPLPKNDKGQFNIQLESLAQFEDMRAVTKTLTNTKAITEAFPRITAIYLQKIKDGSYSPERVNLMEAEVMDMPAKEVMITGGFFLLKLRSLLNGTAPTSQSTPPSPKKSKPASKSSRKRSGSR
jgi:hypothetical protein